MTVRAVLFDLDGTLVDTLEDIRRCVNAALVAMGEGPRSAAEVRAMVGDGLEALCRRALARPTPERVEEMVHRARAFYAEHPVETAAPYPGVERMLRALEAQGLALGVLSNKPQHLVEIVVDRLLASHRFSALVGAIPPRPRKPDPGGALEAARTMDVVPESVLLVGDSEVDVEAGRAAGMITAAAGWGYRDGSALRARKPDFFVEAPVEITALVDRLRG